MGDCGEDEDAEYADKKEEQRSIPVRLRTTQALYANGKLIFVDPQYAPRNGMEVVVTYLVVPQETLVSDVISALRGRGKGENLVEKLLQLRQEDRIRDERVTNRLRV